MFGAWFGITLAVLLGMDVLECFLHTLRLHWVEPFGLDIMLLEALPASFGPSFFDNLPVNASSEIEMVLRLLRGT